MHKRQWYSRFRPLSGYLISKSNIESKVEPFKAVFPSPLGVSYFQISTMKPTHVNTDSCFRPLSGYLISKCGKATMDDIRNRCFRPLSGYLISKSGYEVHFVGDFAGDCFRPLSGYLISKFSWAQSVRKIKSSFPSPLGVSYFQIKGSDAIALIWQGKFPSPLGVSYFQILNMEVIRGGLNMKSFRPLSGYLISK